MEGELISQLDRLHITALGIVRIKRNLGLDTKDVVAWCVEKIKGSQHMFRQGKNWYVYIEGAIITINAHSLTLITAHKKKHNVFSVSK